MAGSYSHICKGKDGKFCGTDLLDHMGDAYGALEECHWLINHLAGGDLTKIFEAHRAYVSAPDGCNNPKYAKTMIMSDLFDPMDLKDERDGEE